MAYQKELKALKLIGDRAGDVSRKQQDTATDLDAIKARLRALNGGEGIPHDEAYEQDKERHLRDLTRQNGKISSPSLEEIYKEADKLYPEDVHLSDILNMKDVRDIDARLQEQINAFNRTFSLDRWDYAIAGGCGLFVAMLDLLCISAPIYHSGDANVINKIFTKEIRTLFVKYFPPSLAKELGLHVAPSKEHEDMQHQIRMDKVVVILEALKTFMGDREPPSHRHWSPSGAYEQHPLHNVMAIMAHVARCADGQDVIPAPLIELMGQLRGGVDQGGDILSQLAGFPTDKLRTLLAGEPRGTMEALIQAFWIMKENVIHKKPVEEAFTAIRSHGFLRPLQMMYAIGYGCFTAVNTAKLTITQDVLSVNYALWEKLVWNGFYAIKWALLDKKLALWHNVHETEIRRIEALTESLSQLQEKVSKLPI